MSDIIDDLKPVFNKQAAVDNSTAYLNKIVSDILLMDQESNEQLFMSQPPHSDKNGNLIITVTSDENGSTIIKHTISSEYIRKAPTLITAPNPGKLVDLNGNVI